MCVCEREREIVIIGNNPTLVYNVTYGFNYRLQLHTLYLTCVLDTNDLPGQQEVFLRVSLK